MATMLKRTPDDKLATKEAAEYRIREYTALLACSAEQDNHRLYMARIRALKARWGIEQKANPAYSGGLLASKSDTEEYCNRVSVYNHPEVTQEI